MRPRVSLAAIGLAIVAFAFFFVHSSEPAGRGGPVYRDFESYYAGGATWRYGGDPYSREVWRTERTLPQIVTTRDEILPFVGPPYALPFWETLSRLPWSAASFLWGAILVASLVALVFSGVSLGSADGAADRATLALRSFAALIFAATFGPLTSGIALGQVAIVSCAAVGLTPFALRGKRTIAKTLASSIVASLQPTVALALIARIASARSAVAIAGAGAIVVAGSQLALARFGGVPDYLHVLAEHSAAERAIAIQTTAGAVVRGFGASPAASEIAAIVVALVTIALLAWQCFSRRYAPDDRLLLASSALPLVWPFAHEHDFAIAFVPALVVLMRARGFVWILAALAALAIGADWLGLAQRPADVPFEALRAFAGAFAVAALFGARDDRFDSRALVPLGVGVAVLAAGAAVASHPLAVWPDGLPRDFHVPLACDAAQTWAAEQLRAGVAKYDAANAALRSLSLLGCALLWFAASLALRAKESEAAALGLRPLRGLRSG